MLTIRTEIRTQSRMGCLTLESSNAFLEAIARRGGLQRFEPIARDPDKGEVRCILLHPIVARRIGPQSSPLGRDRLLEVHAQLNAFVQGDLITLCVPPPQEDSDLKCLQGYGRRIWEMRFRAQMAERVLGVVPMKNIFVGLVMKPRHEFEETGFGKPSHRCLKIWNGFTGRDKPDLITGSNPDDAFSNWRRP